MNKSAVSVGVVMGSSSDWDTLQHAVQILQEFGIAHEARVASAHRMPDDMFAYAEAAAGRRLKAIIAGAAGAAPEAGRLPCPPDRGGPRHDPAPERSGMTVLLPGATLGVMGGGQLGRM